MAKISRLERSMRQVDSLKFGKKFNNKKAIIFDFDGTLIDSSPDLTLAVNHMLAQIGRPSFTQDKVHEWVGNGALTLVRRALSGSVVIDEHLEVAFVENALDIFLTFYAQNLCVATQLYPNVKETLTQLQNHGYKLVIVTNKPSDFVAPILKGLEIESFFEFYLGADSLEKKKPDPMPLLYVCKKLKIGIDECVMIGDSKNDIVASKRAKMQSVGVTYGYNYGEDISVYNADQIVDDIADILPSFIG